MLKFELLFRMSLKWRYCTVFTIMDTGKRHFQASCLLIYMLNPEILYFDTDSFIVYPEEYERMFELLEKYKKEGIIYVDNDIYKSGSGIN